MTRAVSTVETPDLLPRIAPVNINFQTLLALQDSQILSFNNRIQRVRTTTEFLTRATMTEDVFGIDETSFPCDRLAVTRPRVSLLL